MVELMEGLEEQAKDHFKEWGSICRIYPKDKTFPITYDQLIDLMTSFAYETSNNVLREAAEKVRLKKSSNYGGFNEEEAEWYKTDEILEVSLSHGHGDMGYTAVKIDKDSILSLISNKTKQ